MSCNNYKLADEDHKLLWIAHDLVQKGSKEIVAAGQRLEQQYSEEAIRSQRNKERRQIKAENKRLKMCNRRVLRKEFDRVVKNAQELKGSAKLCREEKIELKKAWRGQGNPPGYRSLLSVPPVMGRRRLYRFERYELAWAETFNTSSLPEGGLADYHQSEAIRIAVERVVLASILCPYEKDPTATPPFLRDWGWRPTSHGCPDLTAAEGTDRFVMRGLIFAGSSRPYELDLLQEAIDVLELANQRDKDSNKKNQNSFYPGFKQKVDVKPAVIEVIRRFIPDWDGKDWEVVRWLLLGDVFKLSNEQLLEMTQCDVLMCLVAKASDPSLSDCFKPYEPNTQGVSEDTINGLSPKNKDIGRTQTQLKHAIGVSAQKLRDAFDAAGVKRPGAGHSKTYSPREIKLMADKLNLQEHTQEYNKTNALLKELEQPMLGDNPKAIKRS